MLFSKSNYISELLCPKRLWLEKNKPSVLEDTSTSHTRDGDEVGSLARTYFPGAVTVPLGKAEVMAETTRKLMSEGHTVICEATFVAGGASCSTDIVIVQEDGLDIIEVKSTTSVKDLQKEDVAFQCYVIQSAGYNIRSVKLMHLNKEYVRQGELNLRELFTFTELGFQTKAMSEGIGKELQKMKALCEKKVEPAHNLDCHCDKPYACPAKAYCFKQAGVPKNSVFSVPGMTTARKYDLYKRGVVSMKQLKLEAAFLSPTMATAIQHLAAETEGRELYVNCKKVREFLSRLRYPLHHLDYETMMRAVPLYTGTKPYEQVPFQYSVHTRLAAPPCAEPLKHAEYLATAGMDPRRELAETLCAVIPAGEQTMAYNASFEKGVLRALAEMYDDLSNHLLSIAENMVDLMIPFKNRWVCSAKMNGSYSIKAVLPALCGNDPTLDYHSLPVVHNGAEAMEAYAELNLPHIMANKKETARIRNGLLEYCGLDTLAMDKILCALYALCEGRDEIYEERSRKESP